MREICSENQWAKYNADAETIYEIVERLLEWYKEHDAFSGEAIMQKDNCHLTATALLANIADENLEFECGLLEDVEKDEIEE